MPDSTSANLKDDQSLTPPNAWKAVAGFAVFVIVLLLPSSLDPRQKAVAATFAAAVFLWITEAIPLAMTAMLSTVALVASGGLSTKDAFGAYGDQIILLFVGSFILAKSMEEAGLDRRLALWILSKPRVTRSTSSSLLALGGIACFISLFVSNTATTAMLLPITLTVLRTIGTLSRESATTQSFLLMLTWGSSVAVGTIIGTPPNVLGVGLIRQSLGVSINFVQWAVFAMPITLAMLFMAWIILRPRNETEPKEAEHLHEFARTELAHLGPFKKSESITIIAFCVAIVLWLIPGLAEYVLGSSAQLAKLLTERIPEAVAALLGAAVLFVIPCGDAPSGRAMTWQAATKIEWGTILLFAGGLALGKAAFDSGLAKLVGESIATALGAKDVWTITALSIALAIVISELASNTASANVVVPVVIAIAVGAEVNPVPPALGAVIGSNLGFMLPISTAPNAVVYSTGLIPSQVMVRKGLLFDIIGFLITLACLRLFLPLVNLQ